MACSTGKAGRTSDHSQFEEEKQFERLAMAAASVTAGAGAPPSTEQAGKRSPPAFWSEKTEERFIDKWGTEHVRLEQGNFAKHNWEKLCEEMNAEPDEGQPQYTVKNCKTKIDSLKKRYQAELDKKNGTGSVNSQWVHFERIGPFLRKLPKIAGIPGACDSGARVPSAAAKTAANGWTEEEREYWAMGDGVQEEAQAAEKSAASQEQGGVGESSSGPPTAEKPKGSTPCKPDEEEADVVELSPTTKFNQKPGVNGQSNSLRKRKRERGSAGTAMAKSIDNFAKMYSEVAMKAIEIDQAMAQKKMESDAQIAQKKTEVDLQLAKMSMDLKMEIEKMRRGL